MFDKLLVAVDGSALGDKALDAAVALAKTHKGHITVLTASDPVTTELGSGGYGGFSAESLIEHLDQSYAASAASVLEAAKQRAAQADVAVETLYVPRQRPADAIVQQAEKLGCDLIVMGSHGRRGLRKLMLGSQASEVLARASMPVLVVK